MNKFLILVILSFGVSFADLNESMYNCNENYDGGTKGNCDKYSHILDKKCDNADIRACDTLARYYYELEGYIENGVLYDYTDRGNYYACKAGHTEVCKNETSNENH